MESWLFAPFLEEKSGLEKNPFFPALSSFLIDSVISSFIGLMSAEAEIGLVRAVLALSETAGGSDWKERIGAATGADGVTGLAILTLLLCGFAIGCSGTING